MTRELKFPVPLMARYYGIVTKSIELILLSQAYSFSTVFMKIIIFLVLGSALDS